MIGSLIVGHAESAWMVRARAVATWSRWLVLGLALGACVDLFVRWAV